MLPALGLPLLRWLDDEVIPEAYRIVMWLDSYVDAWRTLLEAEVDADEADGYYFVETDGHYSVAADSYFVESSS